MRAGGHACLAVHCHNVIEPLQHPMFRRGAERCDEGERRRAVVLERERGTAITKFADVVRALVAKVEHLVHICVVLFLWPQDGRVAA